MLQLIVPCNRLCHASIYAISKACELLSEHVIQQAAFLLYPVELRADLGLSLPCHQVRS